MANQALLWIKSFLSGQKQHVVVEQKQSCNFDAATGVPQGSCLGLILFIMYTSCLFHVVKKHLPNIQCYAGDTQSYLSFRPDSTTSQDKAVFSMERCISDIRAWMTNNYLKGELRCKNYLFSCERVNNFLEISFSCLEKLCKRLQNFYVEVSLKFD